MKYLGMTEIYMKYPRITEIYMKYPGITEIYMKYPECMNIMNVCENILFMLFFLDVVTLLSLHFLQRVHCNYTRLMHVMYPYYFYQLDNKKCYGE